MLLDPQALDTVALRTILARSGFDQMATDLLRADATPYSFTMRDADPERARSDLDEAIAILVARPRVDVALAETTAALKTNFTDDIYGRQVALVTEQRALEARLANLCQANEDARNFETEGD